MKKFSTLFFLAGAVAASTCSTASPPALAQQGRSRQLNLARPNAANTIALVKRSGPASSASSRALASVRANIKVLNPGGLSFEIAGFTEQEASGLRVSLQKFYGRAVGVYGQPAPSQRNRTVRLIKSTVQSGGQYDPRPTLENKPNPDFNSIQFYLFTQSDIINLGYFTGTDGACDATCNANSQRVAGELNDYNLLRQMLLAFRGSQLTAFDAWDGGQSDAAALVIASQVQGRAFDPTLYGLYALPYYDLLNRPGLGAKYFYTSAENAANPKNAVDSSYFLALVRYGMAQAAWLKVWIENPNFFAQFNQRYYLRTDSPGQDAAALAGIAGAVVPRVENLPWNDWLRRQQILDTSVRVGPRAYALTFPLYSEPGYDSTFESRAFFFQTDAKGNETPLQGTAVVSAFNEVGSNITALSPEFREASNKLPLFRSDGTETGINYRGSAYAIGHFEPSGKPDQGRITLSFQLGGIQGTSVFPNNVAGSVARPNGFFGLATNTDRGRFTLQSTGVSTLGTLERGAWGSPSTYSSQPRVKSIFTLTPTDGGRPQTFHRNTAWSFIQSGLNAGVPQSVRFAFDTLPSNSSVTASWPIRNSNKWRLVSVPVMPAEVDEARALQIAAPTLTTTLARHAPALRPAVDLKRLFPFGVTSAKHVFYPRVTTYAPLGPGRAYWLKLDRDKLVTIKGGEPDRAYAFDVPLTPGWNAVGVPFNLPFALAAVQVRVNGESVGWSEAVARGWVSPGVWSWRPNGGYARADLPGTLAPFEGYFLFTNQANAALTFDSSKRAGALAQPTEGAGAWRVGLAIASGAGATSSSEAQLSFGTTTFTGSLPARRAAARPPWGERSVALAFLSSGSDAQNRTQAGNESGWAESFVPPLTASGARWKFVVDGYNAGERVVLSWGDLRTVPTNFQLFLVDDAAKVRQEMTQAGAHAYVWIAGSGPKTLRIEAVTRRPSQNF